MVIVKAAGMALLMALLAFVMVQKSYRIVINYTAVLTAVHGSLMTGYFKSDESKSVTMNLSSFATKLYIRREISTAKPGEPKINVRLTIKGPVGAKKKKDVQLLISHLSRTNSSQESRDR